MGLLTVPEFLILVSKTLKVGYMTLLGTYNPFSLIYYVRPRAGNLYRCSKSLLINVSSLYGMLLSQCSLSHSW